MDDTATHGLRLARWLIPASVAALSSACSVLDISPTFELIKATGTTASYAFSTSAVGAKDTVTHGEADLREVCILYNPHVQSADVLPAIQQSLQKRKLDSRVLDSESIPNLCATWLDYAADVEWGVPPFSDDLQAYVSRASLTLRAADGRVLSTSTYAVEGALQRGKWASTYAKVDAIVQAIVPKSKDDSGWSAYLKF